MKTKHVFKRGKGSEGFTLIELSIVLIIIGLLLAAVVKGKDLIRSAELKKFYNGFIKQWELIYNNYYDRTGKVLGGPLVVKTSSGNATYDDYVGSDISDGSNTDIVFRNPTKFKTINQKQVNSNNGYYANAIIAAGLSLPTPVRQYSNLFEISATEVGRTGVIITFGTDPAAESANIDIYNKAIEVNSTGYALDDDGAEIPEDNKDTITGKGNGKGNFMLIINLPYDVAPQIDKLIDEKTDAATGNLICVHAYDEELRIDNISAVSNVVNSTYTDLGGDAPDCGGPLGWGDGTKKYVTALYKLEF